MHPVVPEGATQASIVLAHLETKPDEGLSPVEAVSLYRIQRLAARIFDLKQSGHPIRMELRKDLTGKTYARYFLDR